jgi:hypothetical protein
LFCIRFLKGKFIDSSLHFGQIGIGILGHGKKQQQQIRRRPPAENLPQAFLLRSPVFISSLAIFP